MHDSRQPGCFGSLPSASLMGRWAFILAVIITTLTTTTSGWAEAAKPATTPDFWTTKNLSSAEVYDPRSGNFRLVGSMNVARAYFAATLLNDGRVLITGGTGSFTGEFSSAELYEPGSSRFIPTANMHVGRVSHSATLLPDGRVLITGGSDSKSPAEVYDPRSGTFVETGRMNVARSGHAAVLLDNGRVLVAGGWDPDNPDDMLLSAELYDPARGRFTRTGGMPSGSAESAAILLKAGRALVIGGRENWDGAIPEIYDPDRGVFVRAGKRLSSDYACSTTLLLTGKVLLTGCVHYPTLATREALLYDPRTHRVTDAGNMTVPRCGNSSTLLRDGKVLIAGGWATPNGPNGGPRYYSSAELYDPVRGTFTPTGSMHMARKYATAVLLRDGSVLILGGESPVSGH